MTSKPHYMLMRSVRVLYLLAIPGCSMSDDTQDADSLPPWTVSDSAGVTIVENEDRPSLAQSGFSLSDSPLLSIGTMADEAEYQLFQVSGGALLDDGRIVIANGGSHELRVYNADGSFARSFGQEGEGPGEFGDMRLLGLFGTDSLVVYDLTHRRTNILHVDNGWVRSVPVPPDAGGFPVPRGMFADGSQVYGGGLFFSSSDGGFPSGVFQNDSEYASVDLHGTLVTRFGTYPASKMFGKILEAGSFTARTLPFGSGTSVAVGPNRLYVGQGEEYEIRSFDTAGELQAVIRLDRSRRAVTQADIDQFTEDEIEDADSSNERRNFQALMLEMPIPDRMPSYGVMKVDALGDVWVQEYAGPRVRDPEWTIFDSEGRVLGKLRTPDRTQILEIGEDYILGRLSDELDVEYLQLWRLTRPDPK
jgi:hypothetical protein